MDDKDGSIPKGILNGAQNLLGNLLGDPSKEAGALFSDHIRWWRYKNQVNIASKAQKLLTEHNLAATTKNLKILIPLIESASLEDNPDVQVMWANLLASVCSESSETTLQHFAISALSMITPQEAKMLEALYSRALSEIQRNIVTEQQTDFIGGFSNAPSQEEIKLNYEEKSLGSKEDLYVAYRKAKTIKHDYHDVRESLRYSKRDFGLLCDKLMRLDIIYTSGNKEKTKRYINFTQLGFEFVNACCSDELKIY